MASGSGTYGIRRNIDDCVSDTNIIMENNKDRNNPSHEPAETTTMTSKKQSSKELRAEVLEDDAKKEVNINCAVAIAVFSGISSAAAVLAVLSMGFLESFRGDVGMLWLCCVPFIFPVITGVSIAYRKQLAAVGVHIALMLTTGGTGGAGYGLSIQPVYLDRHNCTVVNERTGCEKEVLVTMYVIAGGVAAGSAVLGLLVSLCTCSNAMKRKARQASERELQMLKEEERKNRGVKQVSRKPMPALTSPVTMSTQPSPPPIAAPTPVYTPQFQPQQMQPQHIQPQHMQPQQMQPQQMQQPQQVFYVPQYMPSSPQPAAMNTQTAPPVPTVAATAPLPTPTSLASPAPPLPVSSPPAVPNPATPTAAFHAAVLPSPDAPQSTITPQHAIPVTVQPPVYAIQQQAQPPTPALPQTPTTPLNNNVPPSAPLSTPPAVSAQPINTPPTIITPPVTTSPPTPQLPTPPLTPQDATVFPQEQVPLESTIPVKGLPRLIATGTQTEVPMTNGVTHDHAMTHL